MRRSVPSEAMPHIIVKLWPGKSDSQKQRLTELIMSGVTQALGYTEEAVSVAFEEVAPAEWKLKVFEPDIVEKWSTLTKTPGYRMSG